MGHIFRACGIAIWLFGCCVRLCGLAPAILRKTCTPRRRRRRPRACQLSLRVTQARGDTKHCSPLRGRAASGAAAACTPRVRVHWLLGALSLDSWSHTYSFGAREAHRPRSTQSGKGTPSHSCCGSAADRRTEHRVHQTTSLILYEPVCATRTQRSICLGTDGAEA